MLLLLVVGCARISKSNHYESPYIVTGNIEHTGSEEAPKSICTDKITGTRKTTNIEGLHLMKC